MIALLAQVVLQTHAYSINSGFLNSTAAPLDVNIVQQFQPSSAAKRVNVLWFASLTLSLITASFGILVKQWLREYLAGEYISPQARLRIRHFRTPGLEGWGVFAIAALLPLILQLALALFFVSLCFFTIDVHPSVGYTTIPLVAGWALLFGAASFAPALSPRCPYKIPVYKSVMQLLRMALFRAVHFYKGLPGLPDKSSWPVMPSWSWWHLGYNEDDAAKDTRNDIDILVAVDATQTDDHLVMKTCTALRKAHSTPEATIDFILQAIGLRLQRCVVRPLSPMLDLSRLPVQTSTILMNTVADVLSQQVKRAAPSEPIEWNDLMRDCFFLLFSRLPCLLSNEASSVIYTCFCAGTQALRLEASFDVFFKDVLQVQRSDLCLHLQQRLQPVLHRFTAHEAQRAIWKMLALSHCSCEDPMRACPSVWRIIDKHSDDIPANLRQHTCTLIISHLQSQVLQDMVWNSSHQDSLVSLCKHWAECVLEPWQAALRELLRHILIRPACAPHFYRHLFDKTSYNENFEGLFKITFLSSPGE